MKKLNIYFRIRFVWYFRNDCVFLLLLFLVRIASIRMMFRFPAYRGAEVIVFCIENDWVKINCVRLPHKNSTVNGMNLWKNILWLNCCRMAGIIFSFLLFFLWTANATMKFILLTFSLRRSAKIDEISISFWIKYQYQLTVKFQWCDEHDTSEKHSKRLQLTIGFSGAAAAYIRNVRVLYTRRRTKQQAAWGKGEER